MHVISVLDILCIVYNSEEPLIAWENSQKILNRSKTHFHRSRIEQFRFFLLLLLLFFPFIPIAVVTMKFPMHPKYWVVDKEKIENPILEG